jgi:ribonuclease HI
MYFGDDQGQLFCFEQTSFAKSSSVEKKNKDIWHIYVDGASRKNPGPAGAGIFITKNAIPVLKKGFFLDHKTNNQAEYMAFLLGIFHLKSLLTDECVEIKCYSDSLLMVQQLNGNYKVIDQALKKLFDIAKKYIASLPLSIIHIPREKNIEADEAANWGIDQKIALPKTFLSIFFSE